jgi:hypothetical protein
LAGSEKDGVEAEGIFSHDIFGAQILRLSLFIHVMGTTSQGLYHLNGGERESRGVRLAVSD